MLKCPNCGARVHPPASGDTVKCDYCGTVCQLPSKDRRGAAPGGPPVTSYPVASYRVRRGTFVLPLVVVLAGGAISMVVSMHARSRAAHISQAAARLQAQAARRATQAARRAATAAATADVHAIEWDPTDGAPIPCDANGDGVPDLLGWAYQYKGHRELHFLVAVDGNNGNRLWTTQALDLKPASSLVTRAGGTAVVAGNNGTAYAFALSDGTPRWKTPLGERAKRVCAAGDGAIVVALADKRWVRLSLADGAMKQVAKQRCEPMWSATSSVSTFPRGAIDLEIAWSHQSGERSDLHIHGMDIAWVLKDPAGDRLVAIGHERPGTPVPMAAAYACKRLTLGKNFFGDPKYHCNGARQLWKVELPAGNPMDAQLPDQPVSAIGGGVAYVAYKPNDDRQPPHLVALEIASGKRRWDRANFARKSAIPDDVESVLPLKDRVVVAHGAIDILDANTGKRLVHIRR